MKSITPRRLAGQGMTEYIIIVALIAIAAIGVYSAFGDKDALFREVMEVYSRTISAEPLRRSSGRRGPRMFTDPSTTRPVITTCGRPSAGGFLRRSRALPP